MTTPKHELDSYEKQVETAVYEAAEPYMSRLKISRTDGMLGPEWNITPTNQRAASIGVYGVDEVTIHMIVDDIFVFEIFMRKNKWDQDIQIFKTQLSAIMQGKVVGWYDEKTMGDVGPSSTLLEVDTSDGRPERWSRNILFTKAFKKKSGVTNKRYESY